MSYYFATILKNGIIFACDRTVNNAETGENRSDSRRYSILGDKVFLPTGNLSFCVRIQTFLHNSFETSLENFSFVDSSFSKLISESYQEVKRANISKLEGIGKTGESENVDALYGGFNNGAPFIISCSSANDFQLGFNNTPSQYICLNQKPDILAYVKKTLQAFMGAVVDKGTDEIWELGKKFLPGIIQKISKVDPLVSLNGDLIFVSKEGIKTFEF